MIIRYINQLKRLMISQRFIIDRQLIICRLSLTIIPSHSNSLNIEKPMTNHC